MIEIVPFEEHMQEEVDSLIKAIGDEFKEPISSSNKVSKKRVPDKYWVAVHNGKVIGTVAIIVLKNRSGVLKMMFVSKAYRGKQYGVSQLLLQTARNWCRKEKITSIFLGTMNQFKAAHRFYEKNSFTRIERADLPIDFPYNPLDDIFYKSDMPKSGFYYRTGDVNDLNQISALAFLSWKQYESILTPANWKELFRLLIDPKTYTDLLSISHCVLCETSDKRVIGMAYLVPSGNPTAIYEEDWSYIRFVSVDPAYGGQKIGETLTAKCVKYAKDNGEKIVALHTSEMMGKAISIYENLGFRILRELEPRLGKRYWLYLLEL
jgi:GNAT superfamily N-acetyltransferase